MQRIVILGPCGAGKSTLARELGEVLSLPVIHLDQVFWQPGWVEPTSQEFVARLTSLLETPRWVSDGNFTGHPTPRLERADTIIHLDYPRWLCMSRVLKRIATSFGKVRVDAAPGCPEKIDIEFLIYVWNFRRDKSPKLRRLIESFQATKKILNFTSPRELEHWLKSLELQEEALNAETI